MINFQHLIQQWAAGLLQNTLYPIGSSLRNSDHQFSATTNVQNARGEFRKWELITATEQHICTRLCQGGVHGAATQTRLPFVLHMEGDTVSALRMAPSSATRSTRILSAVLSRSWATQLCNENCSRVLVQWLASLSAVVANAETARQQQG